MTEEQIQSFHRYLEAQALLYFNTASEYRKQQKFMSANYCDGKEAALHNVMQWLILEGIIRTTGASTNATK